MQYKTKANEMLDEICYRIYGKSSRIVEQVLELNPNLADHDFHLPAGIIIKLPEKAEQPNIIETINLWD